MYMCIYVVKLRFLLLFLFFLAADQADACKFLACDAASRCVAIGRLKEARCVCRPGFLSVAGRPCRSLCDLQPDRCPGGRCHIQPGHGAVCR